MQGAYCILEHRKLQFMALLKLKQPPSKLTGLLLMRKSLENKYVDHRAVNASSFSLTALK
jgi:hypothetical protein